MILSLLLALSGFYSQDCSGGFRRAQDFRGDQVIYSEENFFDSACLNPSLVTRSYGKYVLGESVMEPLGAREIDFTFEKVTLEPKTETVAKLYRARALCGLQDWVAGEETEITGLACDFFDNGGIFPIPPAGEKRFGIVASVETGLRFGRLSPEFTGKSPSTRPRLLDPRLYFLRAN